MTRVFAEIDADLARWTERTARIGKSIETLTQNPTFLRLKTQSRLGALTGASKARGEAAVSATDLLWGLFLTLDKTLTDAAELRRSKNPFTIDQRYGEIDALLTGASIPLPPDQTKLAALTLDGGEDRRVSLTSLFAAMDQAFLQARDIVAAAECGWRGEAAFSSLRERAQSLAGEAAALKCALPAALAQAASAIDAAEKTCDADPLNAAAAEQGVQRLLAEANDALAAARKDRAEATDFLQSAQRRLSALAELFAGVGEIRQKRLAQIADPLPAAAPPDDPCPALRSWLEKLAETVNSGRARAGLVGAKSWTAQLEQSEAALKNCLAEDRRLLDARDDLRGHFSALKARTDDLAARGRLTDEAARLVAQTSALLFGRATPLPEAVRLIRRCDQI